MSNLNLDPPPTTEELGTVLQAEYKAAVEAGYFTVHTNLLTLHKRVMDLRVQRGQEPCRMPTRQEMDDRVTVRLHYKHANMVHQQAATLTPERWRVYDWHFGGAIIGEGVTEQEAWADAAKRIRAGWFTSQAVFIAVSPTPTLMPNT